MFATIKSAKVIYIPMPVKAKKDGGEDSTRFIRTGIRIDMQDGSWWFHHFSRGTWTQHYPQIQRTFYWNAPAVEWRIAKRGETNKVVLTPPTVKSYKNFQTVLGEWMKTPKLVVTLMEGMEAALEAEAEKRAARA